MTRAAGEERPRRRWWPVGFTAPLLATLSALVLGVGAASAAGEPATTFAEAFARSRLAVVATVEAAPPADDAFRLVVETWLKGDARPGLSFPAEPTSLGLARGSRVVLLAMDPASLDFRGTVALTVRSDGTIDPDGLTDVPPDVAALIAAYGPATTAPAARCRCVRPGRASRG